MNSANDVRKMLVFTLVLATSVLIFWSVFHDQDTAKANEVTALDFVLNQFTVPAHVQASESKRSFSDHLRASKELIQSNCKHFVCKRGSTGFRLSELDKLMSSRRRTTKESTTVVTEFFKIGSFRKGATETRTSSTYVMWVKTFQLILNDVIMFTDDMSFAQHFIQLRSQNVSSPKNAFHERTTCVCVLNKTVWWSFALMQRIEILQRMSVMPRFEPQTTVPLYAVVMHTKYAALELVAETDLFYSTYLSWVDIGTFRDLLPLLGTIQPFYIMPPVDYDPEKVAFTQIRSPSFNFPISYYFQANMVWISGSFFFAELNTMLAFTKQYRFATERTIEMGFASSDQQVLCSMYSAEMMGLYDHPLVHVQAFDPNDKSIVDEWFYLAYLCRHTYLLSRTRNASLYNLIQYRDPPTR